MNKSLIYINVLILFIVFTFSGCGAKPEVGISPSKKAFEREDLLILLALRAEEINENNASASIFETLYEKSGKKEYLYRSLQNNLIAKQNTKVISVVDNLTQGSFDDYKLIRFKILALSRLGRLEEAKTTAIMLVEFSDEIDDYLILSNIYVTLGKYDTALKYLESAYAKDFNEKILDSMALLLYVNLDRKKDAIAQLETHTLMNGCSKVICTRLISFYSEQNNIDGLLNTYLKMYNLDKDEKIASQIVQIYGYKKDYTKLIKFLEDNKLDNTLLLQLYIQTKRYKEAALMASKLYDDTAEINYLGQSAIFEYEGSENKNDSKMHKRVILKLQKVLEEDSNPLYLNYIGYLMIDHEIDVKKGIRYIKTALGYQPDSEFYLDSLAWGYYKLGECKKAKKIMNKIMRTGKSSNEPELMLHYKKIKNCKQKKRKGKK